MVPLGKGDRPLRYRRGSDWERRRVGPLPDGRGSDWLHGGWHARPKGGRVRSANDRFGADAEVARGDADLHRAKDGPVGQDVAFFAQDDEAIRLDGFDVMDGEVSGRAAHNARGQVDAAGFDELGRSSAEAVASFLAFACSSASSFQSDGTCGTIYGNHVGTSWGVAWPEPGRCLKHLLGSPCAQAESPCGYHSCPPRREGALGRLTMTPQVQIVQENA